MMDRYAIFVDAGYFFTQASQMLSSKKSYARHDLSLTDALGLKKLLISLAEKSLENTRLLRIYWYDGVKYKLTPMQRQIVEMDDLQLRVGTINGKGQQKGVDSLIVTDLLELATNHAITDALVITGDSDLAVGISIAQKKGVRIAVMGLHDDAIGVTHGQSFEITSIADRLIRINCETICPFISYSPTVVPNLETTVKSGTEPTAKPSTKTTAKPSTETVAKSTLETDGESSLNTTKALDKQKPERKTPTIAPSAITTATTKDLTPDLAQALQLFTKAHTLSKEMLQDDINIESSLDRTFLYELCKMIGVERLTTSQKIEAREALRAILRNL